MSLRAISFLWATYISWVWTWEGDKVIIIIMNIFICRVTKIMTCKKPTVDQIIREHKALQGGMKLKEKENPSLPVQLKLYRISPHQKNWTYFQSFLYLVQSNLLLLSLLLIMNHLLQFLICQSVLLFQSILLIKRLACSSSTWFTVSLIFWRPMLRWSCCSSRSCLFSL